MVILFGGEIVSFNGITLLVANTLSRIECVICGLSGPLSNLLLGIIFLPTKKYKLISYSNLVLFLVSFGGRDFMYLYWYITNQPFLLG
jgi:hypothetical protein